MVGTLFDLNDLNGDNGFAIAGLGSAAVSNAEDVNGDGFDDLIIGAPSAGARGAAYVIFGRSTGFVDFDLTSLNGSNGFIVRGLDDSGSFGSEVSNAGDVNDDGFDDIIVGAPNAGTGGEAYVIFGRSTGFALNFDLTSLDGSNGFVIRGIDDFGFFGSEVSNAGDVNDDGFDDIIIGAPDAGTGEAYVIFGRSTGFVDFDLTSLDGSNGFVIRGIDDFGFFGREISNAGDVNDDGFDDIIVGAPSIFGGQAYVIFGMAGGFAAEFNLNNLDGSNGFALQAVDNGENLVETVSNAGDINGDGFDDLIVGTPFAGKAINDPDFSFIYDDNSGKAYVVFGKSSDFAANLDLTTLDDSSGLLISGINRNDRLGESVSNAGDVNGDGFDDIIVGAPYVGEYNYSENIGREGEVYVIFGSDEEFASTFDLANLDGDLGFAVRGLNKNDYLGRTVSNAGDVNGDGLNDLIVLAEGTDRGTAYIIFGFQPAALVGTDADDILTGGVGNDTISGLKGNDSLEGLGGKDKLIGGAGDDTIRGGSGDDTVKGETNNDRLFGNGGNDRLNGGSGRDTLFGEAGNDYLAGDGDRDLLLGGGGKDSLYGGAAADILYGESGSDRLFGNRGSDRIYGSQGDDILAGWTGADTLTGGTGDDLLDGSYGSDKLIGIAPQSGNLGANENDTLTGGAGSDVFVLGNESGVFYNDGDNLSAGDVDFALLKDFDPQQDTVQLSGAIEQYSLYFLFGSSGDLNAKLVYDPGVTASSETIALLENVSADLSLDNYGFTFV